VTAPRRSAGLGRRAPEAAAGARPRRGAGCGVSSSLSVSASASRSRRQHGTICDQIGLHRETPPAVGTQQIEQRPRNPFLGHDCFWLPRQRHCDARPSAGEPRQRIASRLVRQSGLVEHLGDRLGGDR
jgi:hypothetical protein